MKAENLVPSLETCKKLKDFPETYFFYYDGDSCFAENGKNYEWAKGSGLLSGENKASHVFSSDKKEREAVNKYFYPAPTVSELLEVLPRRILRNGFHYTLMLRHTTQGVFMASYSTWNGSDYKSIFNQNPAETLALLYIELKEKGVI